MSSIKLSISTLAIVMAISTSAVAESRAVSTAEAQAFVRANRVKIEAAIAAKPAAEQAALRAQQRALMSADPRLQSTVWLPEPLADIYYAIGYVFKFVGDTVIAVWDGVKYVSYNTVGHFFYGESKAEIAAREAKAAEEARRVAEAQKMEAQLNELRTQLSAERAEFAATTKRNEEKMEALAAFVKEQLALKELGNAINNRPDRVPPTAPAAAPAAPAAAPAPGPQDVRGAVAAPAVAGPARVVESTPADAPAPAAKAEGHPAPASAPAGAGVVKEARETAVSTGAALKKVTSGIIRFLSPDGEVTKPAAPPETKAPFNPDGGFEVPKAEDVPLPDGIPAPK